MCISLLDLHLTRHGPYAAVSAILLDAPPCADAERTLAEGRGVRMHEGEKLVSAHLGGENSELQAVVLDA